MSEVRIKMADGSVESFPNARCRLSYDDGCVHVFRWEEPGEYREEAFQEASERRYAVVLYVAAKGEWRWARFEE